MPSLTPERELLNKMMDCDLNLYEKILDTPGFAFHFNELCKLAGSNQLNSDLATVALNVADDLEKTQADRDRFRAELAACQCERDNERKGKELALMALASTTELYDEQKSELEACRAALALVEWVPVSEVPFLKCPCCGAVSTDGHDSSCELKDALAPPPPPEAAT